LDSLAIKHQYRYNPCTAVGIQWVKYKPNPDVLGPSLVTRGDWLVLVLACPLKGHADVCMNSLYRKPASACSLM
jgi:phage terminase large subunit-like protein